MEEAQKKFEAARIDVLSDVFVAVAIVVAWVLSGSLPRTLSKIMARLLRKWKFTNIILLAIFCYSAIYKVVLGSSTYSIIKLGEKICFSSKNE